MITSSLFRLSISDLRVLMISESTRIFSLDSIEHPKVDNLIE